MTLNDTWITKKVENDLTYPPRKGRKNETFSVTRERTRAHRSFLNPEARERTEISSRDSLGRFLPDVEKFQTARNVGTHANSFFSTRVENAGGTKMNPIGRVFRTGREGQG